MRSPLVRSGTTPCGLRVVDLGGGTGNFTAALAAAAALTHPVLCVDNSAPMLAVAAGRAGVVPREQDAVAFAAATDAQATGYDRVLLKELVHHIPEAEAGAMYAGLARQLAPGGLAVTVTRPREVDYPLWPAARQVWRDAQPPAERMCEQMAAAGLAVRTEEATYTATMPKGRWLDMVRGGGMRAGLPFMNGDDSMRRADSSAVFAAPHCLPARQVRSRFWSTFSAFDDASLEAGIAEVEAAHAHTDVVTFNDRLLILIGTKPAPCAAPASSDAAAAGDFDVRRAAAAHTTI
jgi:SAM-dependent methyltransferase